MKPSEYVGKVAEELQSNGWIKGEMHTDQGSCLMGAMNTVVMEEIRELAGQGIHQQALRFICARLQALGYWGIPSWNDHPDRTLNEVLDFLHECQIGLKEIE
jgi:hypothetical protein